MREQFLDGLTSEEQLNETLSILIKHINIAINISRKTQQKLEELTLELQKLNGEPPKKRYLTVQQAAELLGYSRNSFYRRIQEGGIPHYKMGSKIMFDYEELENWVNSQKKLATEETYQNNKAPRAI